MKKIGMFKRLKMAWVSHMSIQTARFISWHTNSTINQKLAPDKNPDLGGRWKDRTRNHDRRSGVLSRFVTSCQTVFCFLFFMRYNLILCQTLNLQHSRWKSIYKKYGSDNHEPKKKRSHLSLSYWTSLQAKASEVQVLTFNWICHILRAWF